MVLTYSPHRDGGGALHLLSPTHVHHHDANSAIAQIRRSLSRSPSKGPTFRLVTSKSASPSPSSPLSPSPLSPQVRSRSSNLPLNDSSLTPFPPGAKKNRPGARRLSPMRTSPHSLSGQRSPAKRALSDSTDNGNASPQTSMRLSSGIENERQSGLSPEDKSELQGFGASSYVEHSEPFLAPRSTYVRRERPSSGLFDLGAKSSPLKRGDGGMNLELAQLGSPSAKRRSLHGASFGPDFDIFDQSPSMHDRSPTDSTMGEAPGPDAAQNYDSSSTGFSPMPRRTSSLRKTTLQQRYEKPQFARARPGSEANFDLQTPGAANSKARSRLSLDNVFPVPSRESPFSSQGSLPNASVHPITHGKNLSNAGNNNQSQRHPLSRTITQSSSNSSVAEDSPTHVPVRHGGLRRLSIDFSKSLPMGSLRPASKEPSTTDSSQGSSFATPDSYKLAKPLPAAFMSTGLISKRNKHINEEQMDFRGSIGNMPDTPCKRPVSMAAVVPVPTPDLNPNRSRQSRPTSHSFGTPSTPFNPHNSRPAFGGLGKGASIFGSTFNGGGHSRRGSFLSTDGEESSKSPCNFQSQSSNEFDIPPTPTKQVSAPQKMQQRFEFGGQTDPQSPLKTNDQGTSFESPRTELNCKLNIFSHKNGGEVDGESGSIVEASPSAALRFGSLNTISSFSHRFDVTGKSYSPASLSRKPSRIPLVRARMMKAKSSPLSPASPIYNRHARSPHTPSESMVPPDPSGLSISARADKVSVPLNDSASLSSSLFPPATPTATRDSLARSSKFGSSVTPVHGSAVAEVDISISAKFDKVELVGNGEFSQVFKVVRKPQPSFQGFFAAPAEPTSPNSPHREQVWAVKKSRHHYIGQKDRQRKLQEVEILKSLGHSDHSIQFFDSWEEKGHLYIQTEFCDEGSLDLFLDQVGRNARLDDFRIWKILLEMTLVCLISCYVLEQLCFDIRCRD